MTVNVERLQPTANACPECGAHVPADATCQANLYALLALEWEIPGGPGEITHFLAVASYGLQHPESMGYTGKTIENLRSAVADVLGGVATIADVRRRVGYAARQAGGTTRRGDDAVPRWPVARWPVIVSDVSSGGIEGYGKRVEEWARATANTVRGFHT